MAKKVIGLIKLQIPAGQANPAPPVGPALGQHGVNIMEFCKAYNEKTKDKPGMVIPVEITVYEDRSFSFITKSPPAADLLKKAAGIESGSGTPQSEKVAAVPKEKIRKIAEMKMKDLNANDIEAAMRIIEGTAKTMGIEIGDHKITSPPPKPKEEKPAEEATEAGAEGAGEAEKQEEQKGEES